MDPDFPRFFHRFALAPKVFFQFQMRATKRLTKLLDRFEEEVIAAAEKEKEKLKVRSQSYEFDLQRQRCKFLQRHG
jgi:acetyl-CoA carboxylase beta subunit